MVRFGALVSGRYVQLAFFEYQRVRVQVEDIARFRTCFKSDEPIPEIESLQHFFNIFKFLNFFNGNGYFSGKSEK
jgi:hypothetical protein